MFVKLAEVCKHAGIDNNAIQVRVRYWKGRGILLGFTAGEDMGSSFRCALITGASADYVLEEIGRDNKKKVEAWEKVVFEQIEKKSGAAWDKLNEFANKFGMKL